MEETAEGRTMGMHMTASNGIFSVPSEHLPGLIALILFSLAVWGVTALAKRGTGWTGRLRDRIAGLPASGKLALFAMDAGAVVHAAIVPTHWADSRVLAVLFILDAVGFVAVSLAVVAGWRHWRPAAGAMLAGTTAGYLLYLLLGWETADLVGVAVTSLELAGALALLIPVLTPARPQSGWILAGVVPVSVLALLGSAVVANSAQADSRANQAKTISVATTSPAGPITWPLSPMSMEPGMQMVTPDCTAAPTAAQEKAAVSLVDATVSGITSYRSLAAARAAGYQPITPPGARVVHYLNPALMRDGKTLDPGAVESLVYANTARGAVLVAAMYVLPRTATGQTPMPGGCLTEWHEHTNLCFSQITGMVAGTGTSATCPPGTVNRVTQPMIHVWLAPIPGGPLAVDASGAQIVAAANALPAPDPANGTA